MPGVTRMQIRAPADFRFARDVCSYGYFLLMPNVWNPQTQELERPLHVGSGIATFRLSQPGGEGAPVVARADRALTRAEQADARAQIRRMLQMDDAGVGAFHEADPRWKRSGRARLFRSPTFWEDLVKTVTSCNVTWPSTVNMNRRLCEVISPAFPTPAQLARRRPQTLRARCAVGYRDRRLVDLAKLHNRGEIGPAWLEDPGVDDEEVYGFLLSLPGVGPYAAGNLMQLLGRYSRLAIDTETIRHAKTYLGLSGDDRRIAKAVEAHYERFGDHKFRSYWFELWDFYERKRGPAWTWEPRTTGASFTASKL